MGTRPARHDRRETNPLFNDRRLKLGTFGTNVSGACAISTIDGTYEANWPETLVLAEMADQMAFEALVPVARWRGMGGETNFNGRCFETLTWAAGLAARTEKSALFSTTHVPTIHPIVAAKQATTVDHISGGRFALNIVCGWFGTELEMFGAPMMDHETRYDYAAEWIEIVKMLWTREDSFDFTGKFFNISRGVHEPKPIQLPHPVLMNAGSSPTGRAYSAKYCDVAFVSLHQQIDEESRAIIQSYRDLARNDYGRDLQIWAHAYVVQRETEREAREFFDYYVMEKGDWAAANGLVGGRTEGTQHHIRKEPDDVMKHLIAGWRGFPLVGTKEQIVDLLGQVADAGLDGMLLSWPQFEDGMRQFQTETYPLLVQAGLR